MYEFVLYLLWIVNLHPRKEIPLVSSGQQSGITITMPLPGKYWVGVLSNVCYWGEHLTHTHTHTRTHAMDRATLQG